MVNIDSVEESILESDGSNLNEEEGKKISSFLQQVKSHYSASLPFLFTRERTEDRQKLLAYKFLKGRKWNLKNAFKMFTSTVDFREKQKLDSIRLFPSAFPLTGFDENDIQRFLRESSDGHVCDREPGDQYDQCAQALLKSYPNLYHFTDKAGHPVLYDCCGQCNVDQLLADLKKLVPEGKSLTDIVLPYHLYMNEVQYYLLRYLDHRSREKGGRPITGITVVMNVKGLHIGMVRSQTIQLMKSFLNADQEHYPEVLHRLFLVNCNPIVSTVYNMLKFSLDAHTREKIVFCTEKETLPVLQRVILNDYIPEELGGGCRCAGGCLVRKSEKTRES